MALDAQPLAHPAGEVLMTTGSGADALDEDGPKQAGQLPARAMLSTNSPTLPRVPSSRCIEITGHSAGSLDVSWT
jgi:hypothetical protein